MKLKLKSYSVSLWVSKKALDDPEWQRAMKIGKGRARARRRAMDKAIARAFR